MNFQEKMNFPLNILRLRTLCIQRIRLGFCGDARNTIWQNWGGRGQTDMSTPVLAMTTLLAVAPTAAVPLSRPYATPVVKIKKPGI